MKVQKMYWSDNNKDFWTAKDVGVAYLFYIPRKWWSIKSWKLVNGFLRTIKGFYVKEIFTASFNPPTQEGRGK